MSEEQEITRMKRVMIDQGVYTEFDRIKFRVESVIMLLNSKIENYENSLKRIRKLFSEHSLRKLSHEDQEKLLKEIFDVVTEGLLKE